MTKHLTGEYVSLIVKEFYTVQRTVKATSGFSIIQAQLSSHDFWTALVGVNSMVFGQRYITFSTTSILDFSASKIS
jgi:hypothetical protein